MKTLQKVQIGVQVSGMEKMKKIIDSGIIEQFVLGLVSEDEARELEQLATEHTEIQEAIDAFSRELEEFAFANAIEPPPTVKPLLLATIDYTTRLSSGEPMSFPPLLHDGSKIEDYADWLNRPDMVLSADADDIQAKIIGFSPEATTAILWLRTSTPPETHTNEHERFLIVEGTCCITVGENKVNLQAGDYFAIPLFENHYVQVTSHIPCKAILQRVVA